MSDFELIAAAPASPRAAKARRSSLDSPKAATSAARRSPGPGSDDRYIPNRHTTNLDVGLLRINRDSSPDEHQENNYSLGALIQEELLGYGSAAKSGGAHRDLLASPPSVLKFGSFPNGGGVGFGGSVPYGGEADATSRRGGEGQGGRPGALAPPPHAKASLTGPGAFLGADVNWGESESSYSRKIKKTPYKVLDAPGLKDDFYLNLIDWSQRNVLAVGLGSRVYLWSASTAKIRLLCDFGAADSVSSLVWLYDGTHLAVGTNNGRTIIYDISTRQQLCELAPHAARVGSLAWCGFSRSSRLSSGGSSQLIEGLSSPSPGAGSAIGTGACSGLLASGSRDKSIFLHDPRIRSYYGSSDVFPRSIESIFSTPTRDSSVDGSDLFSPSRRTSEVRPPLFPAVHSDHSSDQGSSVDDWISVSSDAFASSGFFQAPLSSGLGSLARPSLDRDSLLDDGYRALEVPAPPAPPSSTTCHEFDLEPPKVARDHLCMPFHIEKSGSADANESIILDTGSGAIEQSFSDGLFDDIVYPSTPPRVSTKSRISSPSTFSTPRRESSGAQSYAGTTSSSSVSGSASRNRRSGSGGLDSPYSRYPVFTPPKTRGSLSTHGVSDSNSFSLSNTKPPGVVSVLSMHRQEICGLKWSLDGTHLASGSNDNNLCVWKPMHGRGSSPLHLFNDHSAAVKALAWSPHQHHVLASGGGTADRHIRFWNTLTGSALEKVDTGSQVCNLAWSSHSNEIVSTHGYSLNQIVVWKYPSMQKLATLTGHSYRVLYLSVSPDGQNIVTGAGDETLRFWNVFPAARPSSALLPGQGSIR